MAGYLGQMTEADFLSDQMRQDAVIRCLECIGEASRRILASKLEELPPDIEFLQAYWTRNRLAHGYFDINMSRVWMTATQSAPALVADAKRLLDAPG